MADIETVHIEYRTSELYCDGQTGSVILEKSKGEVISCLVKGRQ
jgi:hypothetical protein